MKLFNRLCVLHLFVLLTACGAGSGEGLDQNGRPITDGASIPIPTATPEPQVAGVNIEQLVNEIFDNPSLGAQRCTNCHSGGSALGGLSLESAALAYANLVSVTANGNASFQRVSPNNPDESYLVLKLEGDPRAGSRMPLGQPALTSEQIQKVRDWIANGAPQSGAGAQAAKVSKTSIDNELNMVTLKIYFSRSLQANTFSDAVQVYWLDDFGARELIDPFSVSSRLLGQSIEISFVKKNPYKRALVVLNDPSFAAVLDTQGFVIDGDLDNNAGGAYQYEIRF